MDRQRIEILIAGLVGAGVPEGEARESVELADRIFRSTLSTFISVTDAAVTNYSASKGNAVMLASEMVNMQFMDISQRNSEISQEAVRKQGSEQVEIIRDRCRKAMEQFANRL
jgi:hypothetical protein